MMWAFKAVALAALLSASVQGCGLRSRSTEPKSPGDNFYRLVVNGDVERYAPGERYVVTLVGSRTHEVVQQFTRFQIVLEPLDPSSSRSPSRQGQFQLFADTLTKFDEECTNSVVEDDDLPKTEVQVMWKAPPAGSGCVLLKAMVMENATHWYSEDGQLTRRVCEDTSLTASDCCACDDANYEMTFQGLWSPQTHPKDFPVRALWLTHFSDVIGATHGRNFSFWGEGEIATDGFRSLAEWGSVGLLERELRQRGSALRSIVKAAGLWHPRLNANTSATFNVDRKRHLLSLASMFGPSPDWVVGVNGLDLCLKDCSWVQEKDIDLLPYDAGTDNGISYLSPNSETVPRERMFRITRMFPEDPRAPFYDPRAADIPPLARLSLRRVRTTPRACDDNTLLQLVTDQQENTQSVDKPECRVTDWSAWSECSVSCGKGLRMRTRQYAAAGAARGAACDRQLVAKEMCVAAVAECPEDNTTDAESEIAPLQDNLEICQTSQWSEWSECSVTCGIGVMTRRRYFLNQMGNKKCPLVAIEENKKCMQPVQCTEDEDTSADPSCPTSPWSGWSPCSASCARGVRLRTRLLLVPAERQHDCAKRLQLLQQQPCSERDDCNIDMLTAKRICMEPAEQGPCSGFYQRWTFVAEKGMCVPFNYGGCRGTRNNFMTREDCMNTCKVIVQGGAAPTTNSTGILSVVVPLSNAVDDPILTVSADCQYSAWGEWSRCSVSCGTGYQERTRTVLSQPGPGGAPCDRPVARRRRCYRRC